MDRHHEPIEIRQLRYVVAVVEHSSFRKAGIALGVSQSAVSRCISDLEDRIGASLFHRHTWGVSQTFAGQRLLLTARRMIRLVEQSKFDVAAIGRGESGCVRIGIYSSIASGFLTELLERYGPRHQDARIELIDGTADEHVAAIRRLQLDVAFLAGTREWLDCDHAPLWSERVFAVLPETHQLTVQDVLTWRDLAVETFVVSAVPPGEEVHAHLVRKLAAFGNENGGAKFDHGSGGMMRLRAA